MNKVGPPWADHDTIRVAGEDFETSFIDNESYVVLFYDADLGDVYDDHNKLLNTLNRAIPPDVRDEKTIKFKAIAD
jgi:hypothetical protein